jgi:serine/threonine protein phosphatase 1
MNHTYVTARFFIVGDMHACPQELEALLTALVLQPEDQLVFLGDYVDRGPGARELVDLLLRMRDDAVCAMTFLKGNHEDMFLDFMGYEGNYGEAFLLNGGVKTLASYGCTPFMDRAAVVARVPETHLTFFRNLDLMFPVGEVLCVHAGISALRPLEEQDPEDLLWIRQEFIDNPHPLPYTVVYGHTPQREVRFDLPYKVGIDTGLVYGGKLSCLEVTEKKLFQVAKGSRKVKVTDIAEPWAEMIARTRSP